MSTAKIATVLTATAILALAATQIRTVAADNTSATAGCGTCHQGKRSFAGQDSEQLAARIRTILKGELRHPPLGLDDMSDEAIKQLAEQLAAAE